MKFFIALIAIACFVAATESALSYGPAVVDPRFPGKCYDKESEKAYPPGETWQLPNCIEGRCNDRDGTLYVQRASCGVVVVDEGVELVSDKSLPYPDCCPQPKL